MKKLLFTILLLVTCLDLHGATAMKISDYPNTATLNNTDLMLIAIPGVTNKNITWLQLQTVINAVLKTNYAGMWITNLHTVTLEVNGPAIITGRLIIQSNLIWEVPGGAGFTWKFEGPTNLVLQETSGGNIIMHINTNGMVQFYGVVSGNGSGLTNISVGTNSGRIPVTTNNGVLTTLPTLLYDSSLNQMLVNQNTNIGSVDLTGTAFAVRGADNTPVRINTSSFGVAGTGAYANRHARGTAANPTAVQTGDQLMSLEGWGYGSTNYSLAPRVMVRGYASENWTTANQGSYMTCWTTPSTSLVPAERLRIDQAGNVGVNTNNPQARWHVRGTVLVESNATFLGGITSPDAEAESEKFGFGAIAEGQGTSVGTSAEAHFGGTALGYGTIAGTNGIAIGSGALSGQGPRANAIGYSAQAAFVDSTAIGAGAVASAPGEIVLGGSTNTVDIPGTLNTPNANVTTLYVTNPITGVVITNSTYYGDGTGLTNIQGSNIVGTISATLVGVVPSANLPTNTVNTDGIVTAPGAVNNKVWKTGPAGESPAWRDDATGGSGSTNLLYLNVTNEAQFLGGVDIVGFLTNRGGIVLSNGNFCLTSLQGTNWMLTNLAGGGVLLYGNTNGRVGIGQVPDNNSGANPKLCVNGSIAAGSSVVAANFISTFATIPYPSWIRNGSGWQAAGGTTGVTTSNHVTAAAFLLNSVTISNSVPNAYWTTNHYAAEFVLSNSYQSAWITNSRVTSGSWITAMSMHTNAYVKAVVPFEGYFQVWFDQAAAQDTRFFWEIRK